MNKSTNLPGQDLPIAGQITQPALCVGIEDVAASMGISKTAVFWLIKQKHLPSFKIGKRRLVRVPAMESLVQRLEAGEIVIPLTECRDGVA